MFQRILVPFDRSEPSQAALQEAVDLAVAHDCALFILHVVDDSPIVDHFPSRADSERFRQRRVDEGGRLLDEATTRCGLQGIGASTRLRVLSDGRLADAILQQADELKCDLIVMGSHSRRGAGRAMLGSQAKEVLRAGRVPVLIVHARDGSPSRSHLASHPPYRRILVPVDGSDTADRGIDVAVRLARRQGGSLRLVHVVDELSMVDAFDLAVTLGMGWTGMHEVGRRLLQAAAERVRTAGVEVETVLVDDFRRRVWAAVADDAREWGADLVVIGSHGRRGFQRFFFGSDAEQIARRCPVPVLVVRADAASAATKEATGVPRTAAPLTAAELAWW